MYEFLLYGFLVIPVFLAVKILGEFFPESPRLLKKNHKGEKQIYLSLLICREAYIISSKVIALLVVTSK